MGGRAQGNELGIDAKGNRKLDIPGGVLDLNQKKQVRGVALPVGSYKVAVTGTGSGRATLVFMVPQSGEDSVSVFSVAARKGVHGTLAVTSNGPARGLRFGGRSYYATNGLAMRVRGLPRRMKPGRPENLSVKVSDQMGDSVAGAVVALEAKGFSAELLANASGKAAGTVRAPKAGKLVATVSAAGHATVRKSVHLR